jgi:hypothetical protein
VKDYEERNVIFIYSPCNATGLSALLRTAAEIAAKQYPECWQRDGDKPATESEARDA